ncbi:MAG: D-Ala-D-Ala carboxypeptidase family metallohydrolase [Caenibius sp.]
MTRLSPHFHLSEFVHSQTAARRGIDNTPPPWVVANLERLCRKVLEPVRAHFARPVIVSSGYRCLALNRAIGGSSTSQHCRGEAADIEVPGVSNVDLAKWIDGNLLFDQLILEFYTPGQPSSGWVHASHGPRLRNQELTAQRVREWGRWRTRYVPGLVA